MASFTIEAGFEIQVGEVTGTTFTVESLAGKDFTNDGTVDAYLNSMRLNLTPTGPPGEIGEMSWNNDFNVPEVKLNASVTAQIPLEQYVPVVNKTGIQINDGQAVYISGAQGNRPTSSLAKSDALGTSIIIGVATQDIANNAGGFVTTFGVVHDFDTSGFSEGDLLYVSAGTAGVITNVIPSSPNFNVAIGIAENSIVNGSIHVIPRAPISLDVTLAGNSDLVSPSEKAIKTYVDGKNSTQDTAIGLNTAKVTNATHTSEVTGATALAVQSAAISNKTLKETLDGTENVLIDDSGLKKTTTQAIADLGGGDSEFQIYDLVFYIDSPDITKWIGIGSTANTGREYAVSTAVNKTTSAINITGGFLRSFQYVGVADGNQTVSNFLLNLTFNKDTITHISILKVKFSDVNASTIGSITALYESSILSIPVDGLLKIPSSSFSETSISDGDMIFVFFASTSLTNTNTGYLRLKTTID